MYQGKLGTTVSSVLSDARESGTLEGVPSGVRRGCLEGALASVRGILRNGLEGGLNAMGAHSVVSSVARGYDLGVQGIARGKRVEGSIPGWDRIGWER